MCGCVLHGGCGYPALLSLKLWRAAQPCACAALNKRGQPSGVALNPQGRFRAHVLSSLSSVGVRQCRPGMSVFSALMAFVNSA